MRSFFITIAVIALSLGAVFAVLVFPSRSYPRLTGVTRVVIANAIGNSISVADARNVARFTDLANRYRSGWHGFFLEPAGTPFFVSFYVGSHFEQEINISPEQLYRRADDEGTPLVRRRDSDLIARAFLTLIHDVAPADWTGPDLVD